MEDSKGCSAKRRFVAHGTTAIRKKHDGQRGMKTYYRHARLDGTVKGNRWLADARVADIVAEALRYPAGFCRSHL